MNDLTINILLYLTYVLIGVATIAAIVFPIITLAGDMKKAKRALLGIGAVAVVFVLSYIVSDGTVLDSYIKYDVTEGVSKMVGAVLIMTYILGLGAILSAIAGEILKATK
jgi:uncharacterized membrane protein YozB (DUF420 family)